MTDLLQRLRDADSESQQRALGSDIFREAADSIETLTAQVEALVKMCKWAMFDVTDFEMAIKRGSITEPQAALVREMMG